MGGGERSRNVEDWILFFDFWYAETDLFNFILGFTVSYQNSMFSISYDVPLQSTLQSVRLEGLLYSKSLIGDDVFENVKSSMQQGPFSLLLDASNDTDIQKMFPITVQPNYDSFLWYELT